MTKDELEHYEVVDNALKMRHADGIIRLIKKATKAETDDFMKFQLSR